jgi:hypothetical protein
MSRHSLAGPSWVLALLLVAPASAQSPQFRADVRQAGASSFEGTIYFGSARMRIEGVSDGQQVTMIVDSGAGTMLMLMPDERMYVEMDVGSAPFSAPGAQSMDPANPCSSGEVTDCRSLGSETVNGYAARGWEYTRDGERETAWIANELRFPVRTIEADGSTIDLSDISVGPQPSSLFEPPPGYTAMNLPGFGGFGAGGRGRGGVPPGAVPGRGAPPAATPPGGAPAGVDPAMAAQLAAMGLDPSVIAQMQAMGLSPEQMQAMINVGTTTNSAPWEAVDSWVVDMVVTASGSETEQTNPRDRLTETYSVRITASVPITYGTPALGAQQGAAWQLVPTLGSDRALAQPLSFSGSAEYHSEFDRAAACDIQEDAFRAVQDAHITAELRTTDHGSMDFMGGAARLQISGDLSTYDLGAGAGAAGSEVTTTVNTEMGSCPDTQRTSETETETRELALSAFFELTGLPLPASPGTMRGSNTVPIRFAFGGFDGELDAQVEWTLRPIQ